MSDEKKKKTKRIVKIVVYSLVFIFVIIQFIPVDRTNPPVRNEALWKSPKTKEYAVRACYDCHSNNTKWPFYSYVAPMSWFVISHVNEGREHLNFSEFNPEDGKEAADVVEHDIMPLGSYMFLHPDARLSDKEKLEFVNGLVESFGREDKKDED
ncbi:MAG: heme-binding domain-containing protein [Ignavibacteriae bacterium]|nr:heme-binding domain-containing protein [Ignavibacteriota bacterium]